jgi:RHS repeat-associated protein
VWQADSHPFGETQVIYAARMRGRTALNNNELNEQHQETEDHPFEMNLRLPGQVYDAETGLHYNYFRDYDPATGRYVQSDPIGLSGGLNPYAYVEGNPVSFVDSNGLDFLVIENGPTTGNPIGHTATAVTGAGVYSFGNATVLGSSVIDYLMRETKRRDTDIYIIKTTPEQDLAIVKFYKKYPNSSLPKDFFSIAVGDNCSTRSNGGMDAGGLPQYGDGQNSAGDPVIFFPSSIPGSSGLRALTQGAKHIRIPRNSKSIPKEVNQFEPKG